MAPPLADVDGVTKGTTGMISAHVWAQASSSDRSELGERDGILVVFSAEVDPASVVPDAFLVILRDGTGIVPDEAVLSPANESDENRTVWLAGRFGEPQANPPADVMVTGNLYAENGLPLRGLGAEVQPFSTPGLVVIAHRLEPGPSRCPQAKQVVRTYWHDVLRGVQIEDLQRIRLELADGEQASPFGFDDHDLDDDQEREDNVLDLCVDRDTPAQILRIEPDVFADAQEHPNARIELTVAQPGADE
jgi:hypothetical protein